MATPTLVITATLSIDPVSRAGELEALIRVTTIAAWQAGGLGGATTEGTVESEFGSGSATWQYTPNASS